VGGVVYPDGSGTKEGVMMKIVLDEIGIQIWDHVKYARGRVNKDGEIEFDLSDLDLPKGKHNYYIFLKEKNTGNHISQVGTIDWQDD